MNNDASNNRRDVFYRTKRRQFLHYLIGSAAGTAALGFLSPDQGLGREVSLEALCSAFPLNSRCANYLPGVQATDTANQPIAVNVLLKTAKTGDRPLAQGLPDPGVTYLVIEDGPKIATYGIKPVCTHLGCTVAWKPEQSRFVCPCHGSQYDAQGQVVQGPARRNLPLVTVVAKQDQVRLIDRAPAIDPRQGNKK